MAIQPTIDALQAKPDTKYPAWLFFTLQMNALNYIDVDGSTGEGGGQMVRSSISLSMVTGKPVRIRNIRANRPKPGLMRQHLAAVNAAIEISQANHSGVELGAREIVFEPQVIGCGRFKFQIGTAGSSSLVLQTILPALILAEGETNVVVEGGTHNPFAPPFEFLERSFVTLLNRMGPNVVIELIQHGFYPAGGGSVQCFVTPCKRLRGIDLVDRGEQLACTANAVVSKLSSDVAEREIRRMQQRLKLRPEQLRVHVADSMSPGNYVWIEIVHKSHVEVFTSIGEIRKRAEHVAEEAAREANDYLALPAPVGPHLADQIMLPLAISAWQGKQATSDRTLQSGGSFVTGPLTLHSLTHIKILQTFLDVRIDVTELADGCQRVDIG